MKLKLLLSVLLLTGTPTAAVRASVFGGAIRDGSIHITQLTGGVFQTQSAHPDQYLSPKGVAVNTSANEMFLGGILNREPILMRSNGLPEVVTMPAGLGVEAAGFDAANNQVHVLARSDIDAQLYLVRLSSFTGGLLGFTAMGVGCCTMEGVVATYASGARQMFVVGRRAVDSASQLLEFNYTNDSLSVRPLVGVPGSIVAMAFRSTGQLYVLVSDPVAGTLQLGVLDRSTPNATFGAIGSATPDCCFLTLGNAVFDPADNQIHVIAKPLSGGAFQLYSWNVTTGVLSPGSISNDAFLFVDNAFTLIERLFADGFE